MPEPARHDPDAPPPRSWPDRARTAVASVARSPGGQLVALGVVLALLFPAHATGAIGLTLIAAGLGVAVARTWPYAPAWLREPPAGIATAIGVTIIIVAGLATFQEALTQRPDWPLGDWGPQHAVLARIMPSLPGLDVPVWNHALSTGDAPLELYPSLTYLVTGHLASLLGLEHDLPRALMIVAVLVHVAIAVATMLLAARVAPRPIAVGAGMVALVDSGAIAHGGTVGLFEWALLHSAMALALAAFAALGVLAALRRPRLAASLTIWIATALATAAHPAGLLAAAAAIVALGAVALLAADVPPRRALVAMGHVALGVALGAWAWMPLAERILAYGQHFPNAVRSPGKLLEDLLASPLPVTSYALLAYAGLLGIVAGLWSRRAPVVYVSATALVLLAGMCDVPYLAYDLAPGQAVARLGTERLAQLARPFLAAAGAYAIWILARSAITAWRTASPRHRLVAAAVIGVMSAAVVRVAPSVWFQAAQRASDRAQTSAPDPAGRYALTLWAHGQARQLGPHTWARALFEQDTHEQMHLTAETGLPVLHDGWLPDLLLRERLEDTSEASLRRFNVRWVIGVDKAPSLGDPATEITFGRYRIREVAAWDGAFARIERGAGDVVVHRLDDRAVEIEVTGTTEPVLVALGTGYYPRWRAVHASGVAEPVYAHPAIPGGKLHVVAAWVAPGRTTFTVDGPLPSDGDGRWPSLLALLVALAVTITWSVARWRRAVLRRFARARRRLPRAAALAARVGVPVVAIGLLARGCAEDRAVTDSLELGSGVRATATVDARPAGGAWRRCAYHRIEGVHACPGLVVAMDGMTALLNDAAPSWGFNTPGIIATPTGHDVEVRIRVRARLAGTYWTAVSHGTATLEVEDDAPRVISRDVLVYGDAGERVVELRAKLPASGPLAWTFVHERTLVPPRPFLAAPPVEAPPAVRAIR